MLKLNKKAQEEAWGMIRIIEIIIAVIVLAIVIGAIVLVLFPAGRNYIQKIWDMIRFGG